MGGGRSQWFNVLDEVRVVQYRKKLACEVTQDIATAVGSKAVVNIGALCAVQMETSRLAIMDVKNKPWTLRTNRDALTLSYVCTCD